MKKLSFVLALVLLVNCKEEPQLSHTETAKIVIESFYNGDNTTLEKYTTAESFANFRSLQGMFQQDEKKESNFSAVNETIDGNIAWVKYTTAYEEKPGLFKLIKVDGNWKVTEKGFREKGPF